jgi:hypothetical protein
MLLITQLPQKPLVLSSLTPAVKKELEAEEQSQKSLKATRTHTNRFLKLLEFTMFRKFLHKLSSGFRKPVSMDRNGFWEVFCDALAVFSKQQKKNSVSIEEALKKISQEL